MSENFDIKVKVDPGQAPQAIDKIEAGLGKMEKAAARAARELSDGMTSASRAFGSLGSAIQQQQAALDRNAASHRYLNSTTAAAAAGFGKMAEAIQREKAMFDQIHGPAQRYAQDLQTLDSLLHRNAISAAEYAQQVTKLNHGIDGMPKSAAPIAARSSGLSGLQGAAAAVGVTVGASQVIDLADGYTMLQNRLRLLTPDQAAANELLEKLSGIATRSRADLGATADAFSSMSRATKQLGLSQDETLVVTETLTKLVSASGKSASEASAGLLQFGQALSSGRLQGDELRSVFENMPTLVEALMSSLHVTQAELRKMGEAGTITSKVMIDALKGAAASADASLGKTMPTIGQQFTLMKNTLTTELGPALQGIAPIVGHVGEAMGGVFGIVKTGLIPLQALGGALSAIGPAGGIAAAGLTAIAIGNPIGIIATAAVAAAAGLNELTKAIGAGGLFDNLSKDVVGTIDNFNKWNELQSEAERRWLRTPEQIRAASDALVEFNIRMTLGAEAADAFHKALSGSITDSWANAAQKQVTLQDRINQAITIGQAAWEKLTEKQKDNTATARKHANEIERLGRALLGVESVSARAIREGAADRAAGDALTQYATDLEMKVTPAIERYAVALEQLERARASRGLSDLAFDVEQSRLTKEALGSSAAGGIFSALKSVGGSVGSAAGNAAENTNAIIVDMQSAAEKANEKMAEDAKRAAQETREAWAAGLGEIGSSFLRMAADGKSSWHDMTEAMIRDLTRLAIKMAVMKLASGGGSSAVGGQFLSGLAGGAHGFDYVANGNAMQLPGFAHGGDMLVGGGRGVDQHLAMFRVSAGESIHVRTGDQRLTAEAGARARGGSGPVTIRPVMMVDSNPREVTAAMGTYAGQRVIAKTDRDFRRRRTG